MQYKFSPGMTLVGEYHSRPFSDFEEGSIKTFGNVDDGESYRFGVEFNQSKPIYRLGLFYDALPRAEIGDDKPISKLGLKVRSFTACIGCEDGPCEGWIWSDLKCSNDAPSPSLRTEISPTSNL